MKDTINIRLLEGLNSSMFHQVINWFQILIARQNHLLTRLITTLIINIQRVTTMSLMILHQYATDSKEEIYLRIWTSTLLQCSPAKNTQWTNHQVSYQTQKLIPNIPTHSGQINPLNSPINYFKRTKTKTFPKEERITPTTKCYLKTYQTVLITLFHPTC